MIHREGRWVSSMTAAEFATVFLCRGSKCLHLIGRRLSRMGFFLLFKKMFLSLTTSHVSPELRTAAELLVNDKCAALSEWRTNCVHLAMKCGWNWNRQPEDTRSLCFFCYSLICCSRSELKKKNWSQRQGRSWRFSALPLQRRVLLSHVLCGWMKSHGWSVFPKQCFFTY